MSDAPRVAIIGLGAIGGSAALKLIEQGITPYGFSASEIDRSNAAYAGVVVTKSIDDAVRQAEIVLIAVALDALPSVGARVVESAAPSATILHAASLQRPAAVGSTPTRVIGTHPMAGGAQSGFVAAKVGMFHGATVYVEARASTRDRDVAEFFWTRLGATRIELLDADAHDDRMAAISHLPQLVSSSLARVFAGAGVAAAALGPGGRDVTRLAESSWSMWKPLLAASPARTSELLDRVAAELHDVASTLRGDDVSGLETAWNSAREWRGR